MKTCTKCHVEKPEADFYKTARTAPWMMNQCKACVNAKNRANHATRDKDSYRATRRAWAARNRDRTREANRVWAAKNPHIKNANTRRATAKARQEMLDAYGRKCSCCGEMEEAFLTLEHLNRDGAQHRREVKSAVYRDLRRRGWPKDAYTLMCMNCNWARRDGKECPHQKQKAVAA